MRTIAQFVRPDKAIPTMALNKARASTLALDTAANAARAPARTHNAAPNSKRLDHVAFKPTVASSSPGANPVHSESCDFVSVSVPHNVFARVREPDCNAGIPNDYLKRTQVRQRHVKIDRLTEFQLKVVANRLE